MILWPSILPQYLQVQGYSEALVNQILRTEMDAGPAKARRRFTAAPRPITGDILVTREQLAFFRWWFANVIYGGSLRFGWVDPWKDTDLTNLISNGGFDNSTTGWITNSATLESVAGGIYGNCLQITKIGGTIQPVATIFANLIVGHTYNVEFYGASGTSGDEPFYSALNLSGLGVRATYQGSTIANWRENNYEHTVTDTVNELLIAKNTETDGTMLFDQVSLVDITTGVVDMRFTEMPVITSPDGVNIRISMKLEILP